MIRAAAAWLACGLLAAASAAEPRAFELASGSLSYNVVHQLHEVHGTTKQVEGRALLSPEGALRVQVRAKVASFDSGNGNRDEHMREVTHEAAHPYVTFRGTAQGVSWPMAAPRTVKLEGTLDFAGRQQKLTVPVELAQANGDVRATFAFPISLEAFGVERPQLLFVAVEDRVTIAGDLSFHAGEPAK